MKYAMILAAGRGERMRPLTDHCPKPLLPVAGKPLIVWHIEKLAQAGITHIVINHAWLGEQLEQTLGSGQQWGVSITYSAESPALETAGGIKKALPLLGSDPFLVINGDVWCDWDVQLATQHQRTLMKHPLLAWLLLVPNPMHNPQGDFGIAQDTYLHCDTECPRFTFSGIGIYCPDFFNNVPSGQPYKLAPLLKEAMQSQQIIGELYPGTWVDVGTPERLDTLSQHLQNLNATKDLDS